LIKYGRRTDSTQSNVPLAAPAKTAPEIDLGRIADLLKSANVAGTAWRFRENINLGSLDWTVEEWLEHESRTIRQALVDGQEPSDILATLAKVSPLTGQAAMTVRLATIEQWKHQLEAENFGAKPPGSHRSGDARASGPARGTE
jgi:hypothetical protein